MELFQHQRDGIEFLSKNDFVGALFWDIGCGKTLGAIQTFKAIRAKNPAAKMLVICPLSLINAAWGEDVKKFSHFKFINLHKHGPDPKLFRGQFDILAVNFEFLHSDIKVKFIRDLTDKFPFLAVIDESSKLKNNTSQITKKIISLRGHFKYRVIMSGTPAPNSEMEYWGQITFLRDHIFHPNFYAFRNIYFHLARGGQVIPGAAMSRLQMTEMFKSGWKYSITPASREKMFARMVPLCHFAKKEECLDLPDQVDQYRVVKMGAEQTQVYNDMKRQAIAEIKNEPDPVSYVVARIALTKIVKLRQITSGFAIDDKHMVRDLKENPKLAELRDVLTEIGDKQVIIWCNFVKEILDLKSELTGQCCCLYGEMSISEREQAIVDFKEGRRKYLIANPAAAGHGLTFVNSSIEIFYSLDFSYEKYEQARGRIHRYGQKNQCLYIHLLCEDSIDIQILQIVQKKKTLQDFIDDFVGGR